MNRKILLFLTALLVMAGLPSKGEAQIYPWRSVRSASCTGLTTLTSCGGTPCNQQDLCWDTTLKVQFTCDPASGTQCLASADWKAGGGGWVDNGSNLYPLNITRNVGIGTSVPSTRLDVSGNFHIGSNQYRCDPTNGCRFDVDNNGATDVTISALGQFATSGGYLYTGSNQFANITRATDKTSPGVGDFWYNSAYPAFIFWDGALLKRIGIDKTYSNTFTPSASSNTLLWKVPYNTRIQSINCIVDPGGSSSVTISVQSCNANGVACASVDTTSIICGNTNSADDGSLTSPTVSSGGWVNLNQGAVTGTPSKLTVTVKYSELP